LYYSLLVCSPQHGGCGALAAAAATAQWIGLPQPHSLNPTPTPLEEEEEGGEGGKGGKQSRSEKKSRKAMQKLGWVALPGKLMRAGAPVADARHQLRLGGLERCWTQAESTLHPQAAGT
jgi:hypothetical protein